MINLRLILREHPYLVEASKRKTLWETSNIILELKITVGPTFV